MGKKLLFLVVLLTSYFAFAQSLPSELSDKSWRVVSVESGGSTFTPPNYFTGSDSKFEANNAHFAYYNSSSANISYLQNKNFILLSLTTTLAQSMDNGIDLFDGKFHSFFRTPTGQNNPFLYDVVGDQLIVTNGAGEKAIFNKATLAVQDLKKSKVEVYPNPTSDVLNIKNVEKNSSIQLLDASGKQVLSTKMKNENQTSIILKGFSSGVYYLKINDKEIHRIIKQ